MDPACKCFSGVFRFFFTITVTVISIKPWRICIRPDARWMYSFVSHKFCKAEKEDFGYRTDVSFELENSEHTSGIFLLFKKIRFVFLVATPWAEEINVPSKQRNMSAIQICSMHISALKITEINIHQN
jgi:hypothetical protein